MPSAPKEIFTSVPVGRAIFSFALPTMLSQVIAVFYNMADTFFIGQLGDPDQVAAATVSIPVMQILIALTNLFGIGGAAAISRSLGRNNRKKAVYIASFSIWTGVVCAFLYGIFVYFEHDAVLPLVGGNGRINGYCLQYIFWVVTVGAVPTVLNPLLAQLVRSEGYSKEASFGIAFGGIINIFLDPVFIFWFGLGIKGAGMATMLSNCLATGYFLILIRRNRRRTVIRFPLKYYSAKDGIFSDVVFGGLSGALMTLMALLSNVVLYTLMGGYSNMAIAGMGIAKRIDLIAFAIGQGMAQGILPLVAYNYAAGNINRMNAVIRTAFAYSFAVACAGLLVLYFGAETITLWFINDESTVHYGSSFLKVISLCCPTMAVNFMLITIFQATGQKVQAMALTVMRKGPVEIPLMYGFNALFSVYGIAWATPFADWLGFVLGVLMFAAFYRRNRKLFS